MVLVSLGITFSPGGFIFLVIFFFFNRLNNLTLLVCWLYAREKKNQKKKTTGIEGIVYRGEMTRAIQCDDQLIRCTFRVTFVINPNISVRETPWRLSGIMCTRQIHEHFLKASHSIVLVCCNPATEPAFLWDDAKRSTRQNKGGRGGRGRDISDLDTSGSIAAPSSD